MFIANDYIEVSLGGVTASELIEFLKKIPPDAVLKEVHADCTTFPIQEIGCSNDGKRLFIGCGW